VEPLSIQEGVMAKAAVAARRAAVESSDPAAETAVNLDEGLMDLLAVSRVDGPLTA